MKCVKCGEENFNTDFIEEKKQRLIAKSMCFLCDFWDGFVTLYKRGGKTNGGIQLVLQNERSRYQYIAYPWSNYKEMVGFGGSPFYFKLHDGTYVRSNNVWHQGDIPEHFYEDLQVNATQITKEEYEAAQMDLQS